MAGRLTRRSPGARGGEARPAVSRVRGDRTADRIECGLSLGQILVLASATRWNTQSRVTEYGRPRPLKFPGGAAAEQPIPAVCGAVIKPLKSTLSGHSAAKMDRLLGGMPWRFFNLGDDKPWRQETAAEEGELCARISRQKVSALHQRRINSAEPLMTEQLLVDRRRNVTSNSRCTVSCRTPCSFSGPTIRMVRPAGHNQVPTILWLALSCRFAHREKHA